MWNSVQRPRGLVACVIGSLLFIPVARGQNPPELRRGIVIDDPGDSVGAEFAFQQASINYQNNQNTQAAQAIGTAPADLSARYLLGLSHLAAASAEPAIRELTAVVDDPQSPTEARLDLVTALLMAGRTDQAQQALTPYLQMAPNDPYGRFLQGTIRFRQQRFDDAQREFAAAESDRTLVPSITDYRRRISENRVFDPKSESPELFRTPEGKPTMEPYLRRVESQDLEPLEMPAPQRRWNLTLLTAYEYDSNVPLSPQIVGLGASDLEDSRFLFASFGDFMLVQKDTWNAGLIASTLNTFQFEQDEFNAQDYMAGGYANFAVRNFILGMNYQFHQTLIDNEKFSAEHRLVPSVSILEGSFGHTTVFYEYDNSDVDAPALIPEQFRSGDTNSVGVTQAFYLPRDGRLFAGYRFDVANTDGSDFDRQSNMITARLELPITKRWVADAEFRYFWDDYDNPNSLDFFENVRSDTRLEVRAGLQHYFPNNLSLRLDYTFIDSSSNVSNLFGVEFFTYDRHVLSTQLIYDF